MFQFRKKRIGREKGFFEFIHKLTGQTSAVEEIKDAHENRKFLRVYVELPLLIEIKLPGKEKEIFMGRAFDISEGGIFVHFWAKVQFAKELEENAADASLHYKFISPEELVGDFTEGEIRRHIVKIDKKKKLVELEIGVMNTAESETMKANVKRFINEKVVIAINEDLKKLDEIKNERPLNGFEENVYKNLIIEKQERETGS